MTFFYTIWFLLILIIPSMTNASELMEQVVARVNGKVISQTQLTEFQKNMNFYIYHAFPNKPNLNKSQALEMLIREILINEIIQDNRIEIDSKELNYTLSRGKKQLQETYSGPIESTLKQQGIRNLEFLEQKLTQNFLVEKLIQSFIFKHKITAPSKEQVKQFYQDYQDRFYTEKFFKLAHILLKISKKEESSYGAINAKEKLAKHILKLLDEKKSTFFDLVKKYSDDTNTKYKGGEVPWYTEQKLRIELRDESDKIIKLNKGAYSNFIWVSNGIRIFHVIDKKESYLLSLKEATQKITDQWLRKDAMKYLETQVNIKRKNSLVKIFQ